MTLPKEIRKAIGVKPGDMILYEIEKGVVTLKRVEPFDAAFHAALSDTLDEWPPRKTKKRPMTFDLWDVVVVPFRPHLF